MYVTGKKLGDLDGNYAERKEIATDVKLVTLAETKGLAYVTTNGDLFVHNGLAPTFITGFVTQIGFQRDNLYFIAGNILYAYEQHNI